MRTLGIIIIIVKGLTACALESQRSGVEFRLEGVNVRRVRCRGSAHECEEVKDFSQCLGPLI